MRHYRIVAEPDPDCDKGTSEMLMKIWNDVGFERKRWWRRSSAAHAAGVEQTIYRGALLVKVVKD